MTYIAGWTTSKLGFDSRQVQECLFPSASRLAQGAIQFRVQEIEALASGLGGTVIANLRAQPQLCKWIVPPRAIRGAKRVCALTARRLFTVMLGQSDGSNENVF